MKGSARLRKGSRAQRAQFMSSRKSRAFPDVRIHFFGIQGNRYSRPRLYHLYSFIENMSNHLRPKHELSLKKLSFLTHNTRMCMTSLTWIYQGFLFVMSKTLRKKSAKTLSRFTRLPLLASFTHVSSPSIIKPESCPKINGPTELGYKFIRPTKEALCSHLRPNQGCKKTSNFHSHSGKKWLDMICPLVPKTRNDTAYWRFRPYFFQSPRLNAPSQCLPDDVPVMLPTGIPCNHSCATTAEVRRESWSSVVLCRKECEGCPQRGTSPS